MLSRREALAAFAAPWIPFQRLRAEKFGWVPDPKAREIFLLSHREPFFHQRGKKLTGSGKGKVIMLHPFLEKITGARYSAEEQETGDCVGQGFAKGIDLLTATQILVNHRREKWVAPASPEAIYGGSRVEARGGRPMRGQGSTGVLAAKWLTQYGVLLKKRYGKHDLTNYSGSRSNQYGRTGVPDELEPLAKEHPVKTATLVNSYEEVRDSIANGYPVAMCSDLGFGPVNRRGQYVRDDQGFLRKQGVWYHCMILMGVDDRSSREGVCSDSSWGNDAFTGPTQYDQPPGSSFWIDAHHIDNAMRQGDSFALSNYVGYPRVHVPEYIFW